jgi:sporulation protein YlmC with PRC-barrel domain
MRISDLLEARVETEDGEDLGRVHDVRVRILERRTPDGHQMRVAGLVIGHRGIRERLGMDTARTSGPTVKRDFVDWERVVQVDGEAGRVVVRAPG